MSQGDFFQKKRALSSPDEGVAGRSLDKKKQHTREHHKKQHKSGDEHGSSGGGHDSDDTLWLYSFNDMLFNLLLFFIVMYSISQVDEEKFAAVQEALSGKKKPTLVKDEEKKEGVVVGPRNGALDAKQLASSGGEAGGDKSAEIAAAIRFMLERSEKAEIKLAKATPKPDDKKDEAAKKSKYLSGTDVPLPMQLSFSSKEFFALASSDLTVKGKENLQQLTREVARQSALGRVEIEVHTAFSEETLKSPKAESSFVDLKLSTTRAGVIFEYFLRAGIPSKKVMSAGYADGRPMLMLANMTPKQRSEFAESNERIVISLRKEKAP